MGASQGWPRLQGGGRQTVTDSSTGPSRLWRWRADTSEKCMAGERVSPKTRRRANISNPSSCLSSICWTFTGTSKVAGGFSVMVSVYPYTFTFPSKHTLYRQARGVSGSILQDEIALVWGTLSISRGTLKASQCYLLVITVPVLCVYTVMYEDSYLYSLRYG